MGEIPIEERELVDASRQGDREAFDQLLDLHLARIWRVIFRVLRRTPDAEDITREAFLAAHRALPAYTGEVSFSLWLTRVAVTRSLARLEHAPDAAAPAPPDEPVAQLSTFAPVELARRLARCRRALPGPWRAALALRDGENYCWEDVESVLALPADAARKRILRARTALLRCATGVGGASLGAPRTEELLSGLVDDDLDPKERTEAEAVLAGDGAARELHANLQVLRRAGPEDEDPPPPAGLRERILALLPPGEALPHPRKAQRPAAPARPLPLARIAGAVILAVVLLAAGYLVFHRGAASGFWHMLHPHSASGADAVRPSVAAAPAPVPATEVSAPEAKPAPESAAGAALPVAASVTEPAPAPVSTPTHGTPAAPPPLASTAVDAAERPVDVEACSAPWRAPQAAPWRWPGPAPLDSARRLGGLAQRLGGRGLLQDGAAPQVRITVPREQWPALLAGLRREGVLLTEVGEPPSTADCAALVVEAASPPSP